MTAAVIKHDVNHLLIKNNGNATARQKPLKIFRTDKKQWENQLFTSSYIPTLKEKNMYIGHQPLTFLLDIYMRNCEGG